ncbi:solute carrier family 12 member 6 [Galendromus occidentalis]|uniref:Solute carrier family 12 member 6 n=1 Tax=Galendromus occidentalis TaxID=34638 RepID=A0AAJ6VYA7_9ACAR|nr:solute carrier family 12 member 6 [Galendromus occidentalis]
MDSERINGEAMDSGNAESGLTSYERNLYLYHEENPERPRVATLLSSLANYDAAIPANPGEDPPPATKKANLGTIAGVYFPCIQNIFGVIFFIRLVWIVGTAGVPVAFVVVFLCCSVTFTTCISLSAIATNGIVPAGGSYFMISRSLGPEFGGAVGILFYLATTVAAAMYVTGAVEIFLNYLCPNLQLYGKFSDSDSVIYNNYRTYGTALLIIMTFVVWIGVAFVSKLAPIALFCVLASILSVFVGAFVNFNGNSNLMYCQLGDRIISNNGTFNCTEAEIKPMFFDNKTGMFDDYFLKNRGRIQEVAAYPGLGSGVFKDNVPIRFKTKGQVISRIDDPKVFDGESDNKFIYVVSDITTSFTFFVAIFFPSVTGIMAGSNRSGDLADAQKSIPVGTLAAQITTSIVYLAGVFLFGLAFDNTFIRDKVGASVGGQLAVAQLAYPDPMVVVVGSLLSTIGAGLQSLTGAPRLLQAIAKDGVIPVLNPMAVSSSRGEPVRALLLTAFISELGILIGNLDYIAPILTMFFLMCYMFVNLACTLQSLLRTPNWRPRFKYYHWSLSLVGALLCLVVMFLSSWYYALAAMAIAGIVYKYIEYRGAEKEWGDGLRGLALSAARFSLLRLEEGPPHTKNWRPQVLVLCKLDNDYMPEHRKMITFASQLKAGKGLTIVASVLEGDYQKMAAEAQASKQSLKRVIREEKVKGFAQVVVSTNVVSSIGHMIQTAGLGGLKHNTVVLGWPYGWRQSPDDRAWKVFIETIRNVASSKNALLVPKNIQQFPSNTERVKGTIDVWWIVHDGGLLMLLPFLLKQHKVWKNCKLRIFTVAQLEDNSIQMKKDLATFLYHLRIDAEVEVVEMTGTDISAYTYERTLMMEQRSEMLKHLRLNRRETLSVVQTIMDNHHQAGQGHTSKVRFNEAGESHELVDVQSLQISAGDSATGSRRSSAHSQSAAESTTPNKDTSKSPAAASPVQPSTPAQITSPSSPQNPAEKSPEALDTLLKIKPDEANVRRMHTAVKLNEVIVAKSHDSQLVIINLPGPPKIQRGEENYMEFLEVLTEGLERVLMVRGGGREVITIYS